MTTETLILEIEESSQYRKTLTRIDESTGRRMFKLEQIPHKGKRGHTSNLYSPEQAVGVMRFYGMTDEQIRAAVGR